jgi:hypothetical protein
MDRFLTAIADPSKQLALEEEIKEQFRRMRQLLTDANLVVHMTGEEAEKRYLDSDYWREVGGHALSPISIEVPPFRA